MISITNLIAMELTERDAEKDADRAQMSGEGRYKNRPLLSSKKRPLSSPKTKNQGDVCDRDAWYKTIR
jgi:hypothetical protein